MSRWTRGCIYALDDGSSAVAAFILTVDEWNVGVGSPTIVPIFEGACPPGDPTFVDLGDECVADCGFVYPVDRGDLGAPWYGHHQPDAEQVAAISNGVRVHLCIDQLVAEQSEPGLVPPDAHPKQGVVRMVNRPEGDPHPAVVLSSSASNKKSSFSAGLLMTSQRKLWRDRWEIEVPGGCVVVGDVDTFASDEVATSVADGKPAELTSEKLAQIATAVADVLGL